MGSSKINLHEMFKKKADDLVNLFHEFDGDRKTEFIKKYPEIWDDIYDIAEDSRYHRAIKQIAKQSYTAALNDLQGKVDVLIDALETAHDNACGCCDSDGLVNRHCLDAIAEFKKGFGE